MFTFECDRLLVNVASIVASAGSVSASPVSNALFQFASAYQPLVESHLRLFALVQPSSYCFCMQPVAPYLVPVL